MGQATAALDQVRQALDNMGLETDLDADNKLMQSVNAAVAAAGVAKTACALYVAMWAGGTAHADAGAAAHSATACPTTPALAPAGDSTAIPEPESAAAAPTSSAAPGAHAPTFTDQGVTNSATPGASSTTAATTTTTAQRITVSADAGDGAAAAAATVEERGEKKRERKGQGGRGEK